jgi:hypothetical protein
VGNRRNKKELKFLYIIDGAVPSVDKDILIYKPGRYFLKYVICSFTIVRSLLLRMTASRGMNKITVDLPPAVLCSFSASRIFSMFLFSSCSSALGMSIPPSSVKS